MTICNTGSLATGGHGTALGMVSNEHLHGDDADDDDGNDDSDDDSDDDISSQL